MKKQTEIEKRKYEEAKRKVFDKYLVKVQHDSQLVHPNTIQSFVHNNSPDVVEHSNQIYTFYQKEFDKIKQRKIQEFENPIPKKLQEGELLRYQFRSKFKHFKKRRDIPERIEPKVEFDFKPKI